MVDLFLAAGEAIYLTACVLAIGAGFYYIYDGFVYFWNEYRR